MNSKFSDTILIEAKRSMANILVVDDDLVSTLYIEQILKSLGHFIIEKAKSGPEGVDKARVYKPEIVLMDISMPGDYDGIEAARIIESELNIPIIFITAYEIDQFLNRVQEVGPFGYILKPFKEVEVKASIYIAQYRKKMEEKIKQIEREKLYLEKIDLRKERFLNLSELSRVIVHEIDPSLQSIKEMVENSVSLEKDIKKKSSDELFFKLDKILEKVRGIEEIICDLRYLIKTPEDISIKPENINLVINEIKTFLESKVKPYNIEMIYELDNNINKAFIDEVLFKQIVIIIVDYALNTLNKIEMDTKDKKEDKKIFIKTYQENDKLIMEFFDNCPGIKESPKNKAKNNSIEKNINPFFSENNVDSNESLGLYVVYNIVKVFGGQIEIRKNNLKGISFLIKFVIVKAE